MMARRPDVAEGILHLPRQHQVDPHHHGTGSPQRGRIAKRVHQCIPVQRHQPLLRRGSNNAIQIICRMHPQQLFAACFRRLVMLQVAEQA